MCRGIVWGISKTKVERGTGDRETNLPWGRESYVFVVQYTFRCSSTLHHAFSTRPERAFPNWERYGAVKGCDRRASTSDPRVWQVRQLRGRRAGHATPRILLCKRPPNAKHLCISWNGLGHRPVYTLAMTMHSYHLSDRIPAACGGSINTAARTVVNLETPTLGSSFAEGLCRSLQYPDGGSRVSFVWSTLNRTNRASPRLHSIEVPALRISSRNLQGLHACTCTVSPQDRCVYLGRSP